MSSGGSNTSSSALKQGAQGSVSATPINANSSGGGGTSTSPGSGVSLTPRFTNEEKEILYSLFHLHEEVIDIKYRKKQKGKFSVREAWQQIVDGFNSHPGVCTERNLKQIQKFWLNARLRKQYPFQPSRSSKPVPTRRVSNSAATATAAVSAQQQANIPVPAPIKCEPDYAIASSDTPDTTHNADEYEEIELHASSVADPLNAESIEDSTEAQQIQQHSQIQQITHQQPHQQQQQQHAQQTIQAQQISVDQISADKLTLNDLLHFKTARPREEIILQIKHPDGGSITIPSPTRITIPHQQTTYNQLISEIKGQPQAQHIQVQQYQTQQIQQQAPAQQVAQHQIQQQFNAANSTYCTYTTQHVPQATTPSIGQANTSGSTTSYVVAESFDDKINYFKLKEAELRYKEVQLEVEQKRIDLSRMQEELKHQKEMHRLQVDEMRIKIRILSEEEKKLRNRES